ncbi:bromodomain-containing protein 7-like isoform X2 [Pectinophora gossypiella]|uniref:bromodomain-containing protein 7-like isoform X2 n=1 Tax=Pectinophora gossypiella TaxID=13191 RepID=UPI00214F2F56|nr:bromodomain-containing protein 7-like isoform X2 [Pectinophora gossypiella]
MEDLEKLSCKEMMENSDVEHSANDDHKDTDDKPQKKKRRRREVDMIKLSDDEDETDDESITKKLLQHLSPGPNSPASHREPRTCVLKASQKRRPLSRLLEQLLRNLEKRDPHQFFAWPVNDNFAPNYSNIIKKPMDFSTIKQKIDDNEYKSLNCFISDFKLMCNNAMKYNKPGTVYHKAAKRLLHAGLKQLTPQKLRPLGDMLTYMYEIPIRELGFDMGKMDVKVLKRSSPLKSGGGSEPDTASDGGERSAADCRKMQMEAAREMHRRKLAKKAFPRMDAEGKTTLALVPAPADGPADERMTLGRLVGKLTQGTGALHTPREDRRNLAKCVKPLNYGPFSSFAPAYDGTFATLTKEESHLILHTLPYETGKGNEELLRFAPDSPWTAIYDMEAMFPDKKQQTDTPPAAEDKDLSNVKVDIEQLRSLSTLGIDVDFLSEIEDDVLASQQDYGLAPALRHTRDLLAKLEKEQRDRLSQPPPWHLSLAARPGASERELARLVAACLRGMAARVPPRHVAPLPALRRAMGVTLDHLDTPMAVDDFDERESRELRDVCSDPDSRSSHDK